MARGLLLRQRALLSALCSQCLAAWPGNACSESGTQVVGEETTARSAHVAWLHDMYVVGPDLKWIQCKVNTTGGIPLGRERTCSPLPLVVATTGAPRGQVLEGAELKA